MSDIRTPPTENPGQKLSADEWLKLQRKATTVLLAVFCLSLIAGLVLLYYYLNVVDVDKDALGILGLLVMIIWITSGGTLLTHLKRQKKNE